MPRGLGRPLAERFWERVEKVPLLECWIWTGARSDVGYGQIGLGGKALYAHRLSYEMAKGTIPKNLVIDHLCRVRCCVNPDHMELVTRGENVRRYLRTITHCPRGHEYSGHNLIVRTDRTHKGKRECRLCNAAYRRRKRVEDNA